MGDEAAKIPKPGETFAGKYRLERVLGEGGMGIVYEATHLRLRQPCAIKMLLPEALANAEYVQRFEREARVAATLKHPHVVQVLDVDSTTEGVPFMVIELLRGHDLADEIAERGALPIEEACGHALTVCSALSHAHGKGIIHRDLKPSNLFLAEGDDGCTLKLLDFGISKLTREDESAITSSASIFGTPFYMSPEQVRSVRTVDGRSDVWSMGVVLYEMLTGRVPFQGTPTAVVAAIVADPLEPPRALREDIPEEVEGVILKALQKDVSQRFASAAEMGAALEPFASELARPIARASSSARMRGGGASSGSAPKAVAATELAYARTQELESDPALPLIERPEPPKAEPPASESVVDKAPTGGKTAWSSPPPAPAGRPRLAPIAGGAALLAVLGLGGAFFATRDKAQTPAPAPLVASAAVVPSDPSGAIMAAATAEPPPLEATTTTASASSSATHSKTKPTASPRPRTSTTPSPNPSPPAAVATPAATPTSAPAKANPLTL